MLPSRPQNINLSFMIVGLIFVIVGLCGWPKRFFCKGITNEKGDTKALARFSATAATNANATTTSVGTEPPFRFSGSTHDIQFGNKTTCIANIPGLAQHVSFGIFGFQIRQWEAIANGKGHVANVEAVATGAVLFVRGHNIGLHIGDMQTFGGCACLASKPFLIFSQNRSRRRTSMLDKLNGPAAW